MATVTSLYICISYIYTYFYNFNSLSSYIPIACQSFSVTCSISLAYPFIYTFSVSLYLSCVHLSRLSHVFSMFLFFFRLHIMSLVYICFVFRFYDLLHSMYYYVYHSLYIPYTLPISCHFLISYTFITFSCVHILIFHINLYCTTCSCNCLYFHRIAVLCFSYHVISHTLHLRFHSDYRIDIHDRFSRESHHVCHSVAM